MLGSLCIRTGDKQADSGCVRHNQTKDEAEHNRPERTSIHHRLRHHRECELILRQKDPKYYEKYKKTSM